MHPSEQETSSPSSLPALMDLEVQPLDASEGEIPFGEVEGRATSSPLLLLPPEDELLISIDSPSVMPSISSPPSNLLEPRNLLDESLEDGIPPPQSPALRHCHELSQSLSVLSVQPFLEHIDS